MKLTASETHSYLMRSLRELLHKFNISGTVTTYYKDPLHNIQFLNDDDTYILIIIDEIKTK